LNLGASFTSLLLTIRTATAYCNRPNIREDYNYCKTRASYAEKKYLTSRMYPLLKFCYETKAAGHFRHFTFRLYEYLRQKSMMRIA